MNNIINPKETPVDSNSVSKKNGPENDQPEKIAQSSTESSYLNCIMLWNNDETTWNFICNSDQSGH